MSAHDDGCECVRSGYSCTLPTGHIGDHVAHGRDGAECYRWPNGAPMEQPAPIEQPTPVPNDLPAVWDLVRKEAAQCSLVCRTCGVGFRGTSAVRYCSDKCFFMGHVRPTVPSECWEWSGKSKPYPRVERTKGEAQGAHCFSYRLFWGEIPKGMVVRHICNNPKCANPFHLLLGTYAQNSRDMVIAGRQAACERHPGSKLTIEQVLEIRADTTSSHSALGRKYGVGHKTISRIRSGQGWRLLDSEMQARDALGRKRYGVPLQPHNGRDALRDALDEALDLCVYLRSVIYERDGK